METTDRPRPTPAAVRTHGLTKRFGARVAVDQVSVTVPSGAIAGLIGPNGAGKTTLMGMLLGLVHPTAGQLEVLGEAPGVTGRTAGRRVGALLEAPAFHPASTGRQNLAYLATLGGHDHGPIADLLDLVGLLRRGDDPYRTYSLGMKQRLGIAAALLGDPRLVILDEPTNGVDPGGMRDIRRIIVDIAAAGRTVLVSSHLLSELEQVCDWLVVLDEGRAVHEGPPQGLEAPGGARLVLRTEHADDTGRLGELLAGQGLEVDVVDGSLEVRVDGHDPHTLGVRIDRVAHADGLALAELRPRHTDLQSRYLALVHRGGPS